MRPDSSLSPREMQDRIRAGWSVDEVVQPSGGLMLFSGMSIGYEDTATSGDLFIDRAPLAETVEFLGWED